MQGFDYRTATKEEILERADLLEGMRVGEIPGAKFTATDPRRGRHEVGLAVETWFGIPPNPIPGPDFPGAGIELKVVPLVETLTGLRVKERTVVSLIDFHRIARETWEAASVRSKLEILFVFFQHLPERSKSDFPIRHVRLWHPSDAVEQQIQRDWRTVHDKVKAGLAHRLSEADGRILGPCTKGASAASLRTQPFSETLAMSRAFAIKPKFTLGLYAEPGGEPLESTELAENASLDALLARFEAFVDRTIDDIASELEVAPSSGKGYAASAVHAAVRASSPLSQAAFDEVGPTVRMTRVDPDLYPYEALSFPAFRHFELIEESWQDSTLLSQLEHMLIVPIFGVTRRTPPGDCIVRRPVYWTPTTEQLGAIEQEWTMFRDLIAAGQGASLPTEARTTAIHVRPHGRDSNDRDRTPGGGSQTRKSFWLNRRLVQALLRGAS